MEIALGLVAVALTCAAVTLRTRDLFNPVNLLGACFFANLLLAGLKLSPLQRSSWVPETHLVLLQAWILWFVVPAIVLFSFPGSRPRRLASRLRGEEGLRHAWLGRVAAVAFAAVYLGENVFLAGAALPILAPEMDVHAEYTSGLGMITASVGGALVLVLIVSYYRFRRLVDLLLLGLVLLLPVTRLARLDVVLFLSSALALWYYLANQPLRRCLVALALAVALLIPGALALAHYRHSQGGLYEVNLIEDVHMVGEGVPREVLAYYYRYLVLSFDSFDGLVRRNLGDEYRTRGLYTIRPLTVGLLRLHNLVDSYPMHDYLVERADPALRAQAIATGLAYFFLDFGVGLIWIPLSLSISVVLLVYRSKGESILLNALYCIVVGALALTSFTDLMSGMKLFYTSAVCLALLAIQLGAFRLRSDQGLIIRLR